MALECKKGMFLFYFFLCVCPSVWTCLQRAWQVFPFLFRKLKNLLLMSVVLLHCAFCCVILWFLIFIIWRWACGTRSLLSSSSKGGRLLWLDNEVYCLLLSWTVPLCVVVSLLSTLCFNKCFVSQWWPWLVAMVWTDMINDVTCFSHEYMQFCIAC